MKRAVCVVIGVAGFSGCAASPDKIIAANVSTIPYEALDCPALAAEDRRVAAALGPMIYYQRAARRQDAGGVAMFGVAGAMLNSDLAPQIAQLKGERETLAKVKTAKGCTEPQAPVDESRPKEDIQKQAQESDRLNIR